MRTGVMAQLTPNVLVVHAAVRVLFFFSIDIAIRCLTVVRGPSDCSILLVCDSSRHNILFLFSCFFMDYSSDSWFLDFFYISHLLDYRDKLNIL